MASNNTDCTLQQPAPGGQGIRRRVSNGLVMDATAIGVAEEKDDEQRIDQQDIFYNGPVEG